MTPARFTAAAHRSAAEVFRLSGSPAQRRFAPVLDTWAANASRRADEAEALGQPDLFPSIAPAGG